MGGVSTPGGDGGLNVELNLVPFIDLLSSLVLFLLLSAVWIQVASLQASVEAKGARAVSSTADTPPKRVTIKLSPQGYELTWPAAAKGFPAVLAKKGDDFEPAALRQFVEKAFQAQLIDSGAVGADDSVPYGALIQALDSMKSGGLRAVAISTN